MANSDAIINLLNEFKDAHAAYSECFHVMIVNATLKLLASSKIPKLLTIRARA